MCGMCTGGGWEGGLALLSNLERSALSRVLLRGLSAQGGFEAAYHGQSALLHDASGQETMQGRA